MEYWTDLYKEISQRILDNLPEIAWVDLWHEQVNYLTEELPFPVPAVFLAFDTIQTDDRGKLIQDCDTQIDMYLFYETFSDTYSGSLNQNSALDFLNQLTRLHALFHGKSGRTFNAMRRVGLRREDSDSAGNLYRISFQCLITDYSAEHLFNETQKQDAEVTLSPQHLPSPEPPQHPLFDL